MAFAPFGCSAARHLTGKACTKNADHFSDAGRVHFILPAPRSLLLNCVFFEDVCVAEYPQTTIYYPAARAFTLVAL
jgi:hypothetical protein